MIYLAIFALIIGLQLVFRFSINYEIYILENVIYVKNKLTPLSINIGYNLLYGLSFCQIQINKAVNFVTPYVKKIKKYLKDNGFIEEDNIILIDTIGKNGEIIGSLITRHDKKMSYPLHNLEYCFNQEKHMGILLYDKDEKTGCVNKIFHEKIPSTLDYKLSKINFMDVNIEYNGTNYKIELKNNGSNYYIVNNSLNKNFFKYYLNSVLKVHVNEYNFDYTLSIIDHNVNFITLLPNKYIILNEDDYDILPILEPITTKSYDTPITNEQSNKTDDFVKLEDDN